MYLNEFEERIVKVVGEPANGRAWVTRPLLVRTFCPSGKRDSPQRKRLDRALKRLVDGEVLAKQISKDGGVAYALAETAVGMPWFTQSIRNSDLKGKAVAVCPLSANDASEEQMEHDIKKLETGERRLTLPERRAIKKWRDGKRQGIYVVHQNDEPIYIIGG